VGKASTIKSEAIVSKCKISKALIVCKTSLIKDFLNNLINRLRTATTASPLKKIIKIFSFIASWKMKIVDRLLIYQTIRLAVNSADPFRILI
jgi:hypothetical protein